MMQLSNFSDKIPKDKWPFIAGGVVAGALGVWVLGKIAEPYASPYIKGACRSYLGLDAQGNRRGESGVANVEAARVEKGTMTRRINTLGVLRANKEVVLRSEMHGRIKEIKFKEGNTVSQSDLLIQFEDADAQAELETAKAELELRQASYERQKKLKLSGFASVKDYDEAKGGYDSAKAKLDKAQANLDKTQIIAPFSGTIGIIKKVDAGEYVQANAEMVKLVDNTPMKVEFTVPEKNLHEVGVDQIAEVRLDGFPGRVFSATVEAIDSAVEATSHSIAVRALIGNENGELRSGLYANISLIVGETSGTLMIPESAITRDGDVEFVWFVNKDNQAQRAKVVTGTWENAKVEIINGLQEGMMIITAHKQDIGGGAKINITNQPKPGDLLTDTPGAAVPVVADAVLETTPAGSGEQVKPEQVAPAAVEAPKEEMPKEASEESPMEPLEQPEQDEATSN